MAERSDGSARSSLARRGRLVPFLRGSPSLQGCLGGYACPGGHSGGPSHHSCAGAHGEWVHLWPLTPVGQGTGRGRAGLPAWGPRRMDSGRAVLPCTGRLGQGPEVPRGTVGSWAGGSGWRSSPDPAPYPPCEIACRRPPSPDPTPLPPARFSQVWEAAAPSFSPRS